MTIRTLLLLLATGFMGVLAPGGSAASAAETHPSEITSLELGVWLPEDDPGRPEPEAEPKVATPDSGPEVTAPGEVVEVDPWAGDRKSTRLNSSHVSISYAVFCLKKKIIDTICSV